MNNCCLNSENNTNDILVQQLQREVKELIESTRSKLLLQEGKISEMCVYIKDNLSNSIRILLDTMLSSGELSSIITDIVLADLEDKIDKMNVFYNNVETKKIWDEVSSCYYYLTKIPRCDENGQLIPLKMGIANDDTSCSTLESTLKFAWRNNATLCINAGVYDVDTSLPMASVIYEGKVLYENIPTENAEKYQYFAITHNSNYKIYPIGTTTSRMIEDGVKYACCIFGSLLLNGIPVSQTDERKEPRQSIGFDINNNIIIISCDGRTKESAGMTYTDLARIHALNGSLNAYILDGGGSVSTVLRGVKYNENIDTLTSDRSVSTFFYVAKETNVTPDNNLANDLGRWKHQLINLINLKTEFYQGYIRLRGKQGFFSPGIEMYVDDEDARRSKIGLSIDKTNIRNCYLYASLKADNVEKTNIFRIYDHGVWLQNYYGDSSSRPAKPPTALQYFDTTLGKPIWWNGSRWVDAAGSNV